MDRIAQSAARRWTKGQTERQSGPEVAPQLTARSSALPRAPAASRGFTLIEILVVVVIIGILGAVIVPNLLARPDQARLTAAQSDIRGIANALDIYRLDNFQYPSTDQGLVALVSKPTGFPEPKNYNPDGYLKDVKPDPWGSEYVYERTGSGFVLYSLGADGAEGGDGLNADINYDDL